MKEKMFEFGGKGALTSPESNPASKITQTEVYLIIGVVKILYQKTFIRQIGEFVEVLIMLILLLLVLRPSFLYTEILSQKMNAELDQHN